MPTANWIGGTTAVTQVATATVTGVWSSTNPDTITTTLYDESGVARTVTTNATGSSIETNVIDPHVVDLNNSTDEIFARSTWAKGSSTTITGTADVAGRPISGNLAATDPAINRPLGSEVTAGSGAVSATWANTTANAGPNDGLTGTNWKDAGVGTGIPADSDTMLFLPHPTDVNPDGTPRSYDLLYGLDHSGIVLVSLKIGRSYKGVIGDPAGKHHFAIDQTNGGSTGVTVIDSSSPSIWLKGPADAINVAGLPRGEDALHLGGGAGTIAVLRLLGPRVLGKIHVEDNCPISTIECINAHMDVVMGVETGTVVGVFKSNSGNWLIERELGTGTTIATITGGTYKHTIGAVNQIDLFGGTFDYNGEGTLAVLNVYGGVFNLEDNIEELVTISAAKIWGGQILDKSGLQNVVYTANVIVYGGSVTSDTATTQAQT